MNVEDLKAIWDQDYDNIVYIAQEAAQPLRGWARIEQYYQSVTNPGTLSLSETGNWTSNSFASFERSRMDERTDGEIRDQEV